MLKSYMPKWHAISSGIRDDKNLKKSDATKQGAPPARWLRRNTLWLTADVHYMAADYYDPNKAGFQDFEPFWESCRAQSTPAASAK